MSAEGNGAREVRQPPGGGPGALVVETLAWIGYLAGVCGVLLFGSGGLSVPSIVGFGIVVGVAACVCWAVVGWVMRGIMALVVLGLFLYVGNDPQAAMEAISASGLEPTGFGMHRQ